MVVVGSRGHGRVTGLLLGSVSGAVVRHATCPVAVVHPKGEGGRGILVGADGSEASIGTLDVAYAVASTRQAPMTVVHCLWEAMPAQVRWSHLDGPDPEIQEARQRVTESLAGLTQKFPDVDVHVSVAKGAIDSCLVELSSEFDLLVIGRAPSSLGEHVLFNGVTTSIAEHAHTPVIVVP
jgi:nucleotide-binding universal stress UspA family protein